MAVARKLVLPLALGVLLALAGCTSGGGGNGGAGGTDDTPKVEATDSTGGIRGVVVDERIVPIKGATIEVVNTGKNVTTAEDGLFAISGLEPGTYVVKARHPLYGETQQSADVVAGEDEPQPLKFQLVRTILETPYFYTLQFDGYIVCSANVGLPDVGYFLSEECGEGVGVPGVGRVGGQGNNNVQYDFSPENSGLKAIIVEQSWEATSDAGKGLYSPVSTEWVCDPGCSGNTFAEVDGESPTYAYINETMWQKEKVNMTAGTVVSIFTWASPAGTTGGSVTLQQQYRMFVTLFYYLPPPAGWSFIEQSPDPFK